MGYVNISEENNPTPTLPTGEGETTIVFPIPGGEGWGGVVFVFNPHSTIHPCGCPLFLIVWMYVRYNYILPD